MSSSKHKRTDVQTLEPAPKVRDTFLDFSPPCIGEEEIAAVVATLRSAWITTGPAVRRFEQAFAVFLGVDAAIAVSSATAALHVALVTAGIGQGDVVITTPMTFCSSVHVIEHVGARPLLVDVDPETLNIDPANVERAIAEHDWAPGARSGVPNARLRAILPVHLYGHPCDMDALDALAGDRELAIIEDAAHALPAAYKGRTIGNGNGVGAPQRYTCFSFYATKNLTTGEGGMLITPPGAESEARLWTLHGMSRDAYKRYTAEGSWFYEVVRPGFKYNMTDLQAAIGLQQLKKLRTHQTRRHQIVERYNEAFAAYDELQIPAERKDVQHAWHVYALRLNAGRFRGSGADQSSEVRSQFIEGLKRRNIGASVHFIPIHLHPYYRDKYGYRPDAFPVALREYQRSVSLPLHPGMTDRDVDDVIAAVRDIVVSWGR
jgi:dTDP-4-amino-4,6-dideoxygalactose transaminase